MKSKIILAMVAVGVLLTGCGGGGASNDNVTTVTGKVIDGYLVGAKVCIDQNQNNLCDAGELSTTTTSGGEYSFDIFSSNKDKYPIVAEILTSTIDEDDGLTVAKPYNLIAPAGMYNITPITDMIFHQIKNNNTSLEIAKTEISTMLNMDKEILTDDYVLNPTATMNSLHDIAKVIAGLKGAIQEDVKTQAGTQLDSLNPLELQNYISSKVIEKLSTIQTALTTENTQETLNSLKTQIDTINFKSVFGLNSSNTNTSDTSNINMTIQTLANSGGLNLDDVVTNQAYRYIHETSSQKTIKVSKQENEVCFLNVLNTTNLTATNPQLVAFNPKIYTLSGATNTTTGGSLTKWQITGGVNDTVSIGLVMGTEESNFDFYVTCE